MGSNGSMKVSVRSCPSSEGPAEAMEVLAIIPARGGSHRLPKKNVRLVAGRPLVAHTIEHARLSRVVTRTVVSTEDPEIASVSREAGAEVIERPAVLASSTATSESALLHVLEHLERTEGYRPDIIVFLQCTSPVRQPDDIDRAVQTLLNSGADSLFSATRSHWLIWRSEGPWVKSFNYDFRVRRREQDMEDEWRENGSIYVLRPWVLVLSTEENPVVAARCQKVRVECRQGLADKAAALAQYAAERKIPLSDIVYVGNDLNDRECLTGVGCGIVVADAHPAVRDLAQIRLEHNGGTGAVREVCDLVLAKIGGAA